MGQSEQTVPQKLSEMYGEFMEHKVQPVHQPDVGMGGLTIVETSVDAFALNPSVSGRSLEILPPKDNGKDEIGVIRQLIGLAFASRILHDKNRGYYELALLKNSMLAQAAKHFDFSPMTGQYEWTFKFPGPDGLYFRDIDNAAGYEIRLYICRSQPLHKLDTDNTEFNRRK